MVDRPATTSTLVTVAAGQSFGPSFIPTAVGNATNVFDADLKFCCPNSNQIKSRGPENSFKSNQIIESRKCLQIKSNHDLIFARPWGPTTLT